ncbi:MAG TPA: SUMF1/EgtB/PvdO family nonheme iron enzyme, partial [Pyrinomonadaceae bacterium]
MVCPRCGEELKENARFCSSCGLSFADTPSGRAHAPDSTGARVDTLLNQVLDGKYFIAERLGVGGMGVVYRARRVHIGDEVAVKVLHKQLVADSEMIERFRREARAAALLRHPNIVSIIDLSEARGRDAPAYIVMELIEGESLRALLRREGRLEALRAVSLMRDICAGVGAAHRKGIFHRDLKPDNVIVVAADEDRERETIKVVDFGIAKLRDAAGATTLTQTGMVMGTPYYMSPEQCQGEALDARADVYSLGAIVYEMLAGGPPFTAETPTGLIARHLFDPVPPLPKSAGASPALEAIIMRALAKDREERQRDAAELSRELREAIETPAATTLAQIIKLDEGRDRAQAADLYPTEVLDAGAVVHASARYASTQAAPTIAAYSLPPVMKNRIGMEFVLVPAGSFMMGSENGDKNEKPAHQVTINCQFYMGKYEVTQAQWQQVLSSNPSNFKNCDQCPVENVSWNDAQEFIKKLNAQNDGYSYRLPSEAEWEYACRAGTIGDYAGDMDEIAWYIKNSGSKTHPVGQKQANAWSLYDMHGNVREWCEDVWHENYKGTPSDGSAWLIGGNSNLRVLRGG